MSFKKGNIQSIIHARNTNKTKNPNGYIYILKLKGFNLYKIGVSSNPKRRIYDIDSNSPFGIETISLNWFKNVYELEECIHDSFKENYKRKEWFEIHSEDINTLLNQLKEMSEKGIYLIKK